MELVQIYTVVEAKSVNELVKLTNIKTKLGWICLGGMCYTPGNFCEADSQSYLFCQSMYRMEKPKREIPKKDFVAFPYEKVEKSITPQDLPPVPNKIVIKPTPPFKKNNKKSYGNKRHPNKNK